MVAGLRGVLVNSMEKRLKARLHLYSPGGQLACELAKNPTVMLINDTLFAHGGVLPRHGARLAAPQYLFITSYRRCYPGLSVSSVHAISSWAGPLVAAVSLGPQSCSERRDRSNLAGA